MLSSDTLSEYGNTLIMRVIADQPLTYGSRLIIESDSFIPFCPVIRTFSPRNQRNQQ